ncbi:MAG: methylenetetrahydrofolate reductase [Thermacetogeniaceae bacterium]
MTEANSKPEGNLKSGSALERTYASGQFVVTGEIGPPKESSFHHVEMYGQGMKGRVDSVNFTDNQTAVTRLSSWAASVKLVQMGMEPNLQVVCRDRNRLAIQSDLLGAYALGVRNVLCLTGDHQAFGNHPGCKGVYDVDSIQLIGILKRLRDEGCFECGEECKHNPKFFIGCAANPFADPFEFRVVRLEKKIEAGADFVQTQCILDMERFERFMELVRERGLHKRIYLAPGLMPVKSPKMARYMQHGVPGMIVSEEFCQFLEKAPNGKIAALDLTVNYIKHVQQIEGVSGCHIMAVAWEEVVPLILTKAGVLPRPFAAFHDNPGVITDELKALWKKSGVEGYVPELM